jgi:glycosyltransferase involved in cell wall biosynthesis
VTVDILIPALNEADRIGATIAAVRRAVSGRIIVVDDGSTDGTADAAERAGADLVLRHPRNLGKGAALSHVLGASDADLVLMLDADLGETASLAAPLVEAVASGRCDMAVAAFPQTGRKSGVGLAQGLARRGIARRTGVTLVSPLSGQRCISREWLTRLGGFAPGFQVETALTLGLLAKGGTLLEIPLAFRHRKTGRSVAGFLHRGRQAWAVWRALASAPGSGRGRHRHSPRGT